MKGVFAGKKTYILAGLAILSTWTYFLVGDSPLEITDVIRHTVEALLAVTIRHGISTRT